jgi:hypothetical protein
MITKGVLGKKIVAVRQRKFYNDHTGRMSVDVLAIVLEDGTELRPVTIELAGDYGHSISVSKPKPKRIHATVPGRA